MTREQVVERLARLELDSFDAEEAQLLVDLLSRVFTPLLCWTWCTFWSHDLGGVPIVLIEDGRAREVFAHARRMVEERIAA